MADLRGKSIHVAGAGAVGLACALRLAEAGARVTVADPRSLGDNASGVAAGMLSPALECLLDPVSRDHFALLVAARNLWPAFAAASGIALDRSGALYVGHPWAAAKSLVELGAPFELAADEDLSHRQPALAPGMPGLFLPDEWRLDALPALRALRQACVTLGVAFSSESTTSAPEDGILICATGFAQGLAPELARLTPIKGHILRYPDVQWGGPFVRADGAYLAPGADGVRVGATMEPGLRDLTIDRNLAGGLAAYAEVLAPGLAGQEFIAEAGIRAASPDGLPLVGWSSSAGVLVAAGARRNGWLLAPMIADRITALAAGRDPDPRTAAFDARRFD